MKKEIRKDMINIKNQKKYNRLVFIEIINGNTIFLSIKFKCFEPILIDLLDLISKHVDESTIETVKSDISSKYENP